MQAMTYPKLSSLISMLLFLPLACDGFTLAGQVPNQDTQIRASIKMLWSEDKTEREAGKESLRQKGAGAKAALLALLKELIEQHGPRFATGTEKEGNEVYEKLDPKNLSEAIPQTKEEGKRHQETARKFAQMEITGRLRKDVIEILSYLGPDDAISYLTHRLAAGDGYGPRRNAFSSENDWIPEMEALMEFGPPAASAIIDALQSAMTIAATPWQAKGVEIPWERVKGDAAFIQLRATTLLVEMGEVRALPALKSLVVDQQSRAFPYIQEAIQKLEKKAGQ